MQTSVTPAALAVFEASPPGVAGMVLLLERHFAGDWGKVDKHDRQMNELAVRDGARIMSVYEVCGERVWIITDAADDDGVRHTTTVLLPSDY